LRSARAVFDVDVVVSVVLLPEFEAVEPLVSVDELPEALGVVDDVLGEVDDAPMLDVPVEPDEPAVPEFEVVPLLDVPELPAVLGLVELFDVDGLLVDEDDDGLLLELEPLDVWPMARPTPPAKAAAIANVVRLFFVAFISVLLQSKRFPVGIGL
jgi:hypothetical protein